MISFLNYTTRIIVILLLLIISFASCSDEFDLFRDEISLIDDYEEVALVYSNINIYDTLHYVRVGRGFAVENFTEYATNLDSLYFDPNEITVNTYVIKVHEMQNNTIIEADTLAVYKCHDTIIDIQNSGQIGSTQFPIYYFVEKRLSNFGFDDTYLGVEVITSKKKTYSHTKMVDGAKFELSQYAATFPIENNTFDVWLVPPLHSQRLLVKMYCQYFEVKITNGRLDTVYYTFDVDITDDTYLNEIEEEKVVTYRNNTSIFYNALARDIIENGDTVNTIFRKMHKLYFKSQASNRDLMQASTILNFNGIGFNDMPIYYSNIHNGLGFFSSYGVSGTRKFYYSQRTVNTVIDLYGQKYLFSGE